VEKSRRHDHPAIEIVDVAAERILKLERDPVVLLRGDAQRHERDHDEHPRHQAAVESETR